MEALFIVIVVDALVCGVLGAVVGSSKNATGTGCVLGFLFGPLGVIAAFALDQRPMCPQCQGRLNGRARVCQHCKTELVWLATGEYQEDAKPFTPESAASEKERRQKRAQADLEARQRQEEIRKQERAEAERRRQEKVEAERRRPLALRYYVFAFKVLCVIVPVCVVAVALIAESRFYSQSSEDAQTRWMRLHPQPKHSEKEFEGPVVDVTKGTDKVNKVSDVPVPPSVGDIPSPLPPLSEKTRQRSNDAKGGGKAQSSQPKELGSAVAIVTEESLIEQLRDKNDLARLSAARDLGDSKFQSELAVPALIDALSDPHGYVREAAAQSLGKHGSKARSAAGALRAAASSDERTFVRDAAAEALRRIND